MNAYCMGCHLMQWFEYPDAICPRCNKPNDNLLDLRKKYPTQPKPLMITDHPPEELSPKARLTKQLYDTIHAYANEVFPPTQIDDYREEILRFLADSLTTFTTRGIDKFSAGQLEHGGNFFRCNFRKEQVQEQYDGFFYANGDAWATAHPEALEIEEPK